MKTLFAIVSLLGFFTPAFAQSAPDDSMRVMLILGGAFKEPAVTLGAAWIDNTPHTTHFGFAMTGGVAFVGDDVASRSGYIYDSAHFYNAYFFMPSVLFSPDEHAVFGVGVGMNARRSHSFHIENMPESLSYAEDSAWVTEFLWGLRAGLLFDRFGLMLSYVNLRGAGLDLLYQLGS